MPSVRDILLRLLAPARGDGPRPVAVSLLLFAAGAALACFWVLSIGGWLVFTICLGTIMLAARACVAGHGHRTWRVIARLLLGAMHLFWFYSALALAAVLAWSVPWSVWLVIGVLGLLAVAGACAARARVRVPTALPLGIAITALLGGWMREDEVLRCDDYLRLQSSAVTVVLPTTPELAGCAPGETLIVERYPRRFWEYPDGQRFLVTTQRGAHNLGTYTPSGRAVPNWLSGAACLMAVGATEAPHCFGDGKAHGLAASTRLNRLFIAAYGAGRGTTYALPLDGSFEPIAEVHLPSTTGQIYLDDERDTIGLFEDQANELYRLRASDLAVLGTLPAPFVPDDVHYDQTRHQGVGCVALGPLRRIDGQAYAAVAFEGTPFSARALAPSSQYPSTWLALSWGCDWDPQTRRVYAAIATLGLLQ
ncbi:MAG: hypothetical protein ABI629_02935 [bacterium]